MPSQIFVQSSQNGDPVRSGSTETSRIAIFAFWINASACFSLFVSNTLSQHINLLYHGSNLIMVTEKLVAAPGVVFCFCFDVQPGGVAGFNWRMSPCQRGIILSMTHHL